MKSSNKHGKRQWSSQNGEFAYGAKRLKTMDFFEPGQLDVQARQDSFIGKLKAQGVKLPEKSGTQVADEVDLLDKSPLWWEEVDASLIDDKIRVPNNLLEGLKKADPGFQFLLTTDEKKRLDKNKRKQICEEKQEKIRMGVEAPPPPKVKLSNMMRVLADQHISNPTELEKKVKDMTEERMRKQEEADNKLRVPPAQQRAARVRYWREGGQDKSLELACFLIRENHLQDPHTRTRVDINARQLGLTGYTLVYEPLGSLLVCEGTKKGLRKFERLLNNRMAWEKNMPEEASDEDSPEETEANRRNLEYRRSQVKKVWQTSITAREYPRYSSFETQQEAEIHDFFEVNPSMKRFWTFFQK